MSGGMAFLFDLDPARVNTGMVDIEPLDDADRELVEDLVRRHAAETGSRLAGELIADWPASVGRFAKIMPRDYRRVLAIRAQAQRDGLDVGEQIMAAISD
jgi:glutamate synthase (NADPH/NADH) large chain